METPVEGVSIGESFGTQQLVNQTIDIAITSFDEQWKLENMEVILIIFNNENEILEATSLKLLE